MPVALLYSAPEEEYIKHISRCREKFELIFPVFYPTIMRFFETSMDKEILKNSFLKMILFHDLGKLTKKWQEKVGGSSRLPSHSTLGAVYLWKTLPDGIKEPISFAVAIHHTDRGLLGDNIEKPDVQAILDGIADYNGKIIWHDEVKNLTQNYFPNEVRDLNISSLKEMARGLRVWAKGCGLLGQHQRRLQASLAHHILKLCDISAATERKEYQKRDDQDYYGGWLMVENIKKYTDNLQIRLIAKHIKNNFNPRKIILFGSRAYGIPTGSSDLDLFVIMETNLRFPKQAAIIRLKIDELTESCFPIDIIVRTPEFVEERLKEGDIFIKTVLEKGVEL